MRRTWIGFAIAALTTLAVQAQSSTATGRVGATIIRPAQTFSASDFTVTSASQGRIEITQENGVAVNGRTTSETATSAVLVFKGAPRETIALVLPGRVELRSADGTTLAAEGFTSSFTTGTLNLQGERRIAMGTSLTVSPNQKPGTYVGHADIVVAYN